MSGDWLDRAALAAGKPFSRREILKLGVASALAVGPFGTLFRTGDARAAATDATDCLYCTWSTDQRNADDKKACAAVFALGVSPLLTGGRIACVGLVFSNWYDGYDGCRNACAQKPRPAEPTHYREANPSLWDPPRKKAPPPEPPPEPKKPKKPSKKPSPVTRKVKRPPAGGAAEYCAICLSLKPPGYCLPCAGSPDGKLCCSQPPTAADPNPCCPKS
jgi:hypothetical protein